MASTPSSHPEEEAVQVAVRVRIFNERERAAGASLIIRMTRELQGSKTFITNPETKDIREFKFDYSFNSHKDDPSVGPYATQDSVFEDLGKPVLANALEGKNVCLFAYGQTGAGKSFSMIGGKSGRAGEGGIIPRTCEEIFKVRDRTIAENKSATTHEITTEVIEIYCEQINDLLLERSKWPPKGFPLRMAKGGFTCPDTIKAPCASYAQVQKNFDRADSNRSIGAHQLNTTSSRAHTIFKIEYTKTTVMKEEGKKQIIVAQLNLVDLAGSERTEIAGTSGQMLEEGKAINLSLSTLGNTIKALTTPGERPNFRESKLTMLLMNSMTSGKVIMIAAISPASICYNETISTLRFAERIKLVKIKVAKNITTDPIAELQKQMEAMRLRMQEEIDELKRAQSKKNRDSDDPAALEELRRIMEDRSEDERLMREGLQEELMRLKETAEERARRVAAFSEQQDKEWENVHVMGKDGGRGLDVPYLANLHEDPRLAETLVYPIDEPVVSCGRINPDDPPALEFNGLGMIKNHCFFEYDAKKGQLSITPGRNASCFVNGRPITTATQLLHNSRLWLGNNYAFRVVIPGQEAKGEKFPNKPDGNPDYLLAEAELSNFSEKLGGGHGNNGGNAPESAKDAFLRHQLNDAFRKIEQANIIASDLEIDAHFAPKIIRNRETKEDNVVVQAELPQGTIMWPWARFTSRLVDMVSLWQSWQYAMANDESFELPFEDTESMIPSGMNSSSGGAALGGSSVTMKNPFIDNDFQLVGEADVYLACLGNMIENPFDVALLSVTGQQEGRLKVTIAPLGKDGSEGPDFDDDNDPFVDSPSEIKNTEIQFQVQISQLIFDVDVIKGNGKPRFKEVFVRYKFNRNDADEPFVETARSDAHSESIDLRFNYKHNHKVFVDGPTFNHITKGRMTLQVWGKIADVKPQFSRVPSALSGTMSMAPLNMAAVTAAANSSTAAGFGGILRGGGVTPRPGSSTPRAGCSTPRAGMVPLISVPSVAAGRGVVTAQHTQCINQYAHVVLPPGWKRQMVFVAPDGTAYWDPPANGHASNGSVTSLAVGIIGGGPGSAAPTRSAMKKPHSHPQHQYQQQQQQQQRGQQSTSESTSSLSNRPRVSIANNPPSSAQASADVSSSSTPSSPFSPARGWNVTKKPPTPSPSARRTAGLPPKSSSVYATSSPSSNASSSPKSNVSSPPALNSNTVASSSAVGGVRRSTSASASVGAKKTSSPQDGAGGGGGSPKLRKTTVRAFDAVGTNGGGGAGGVGGGGMGVRRSGTPAGAARPSSSAGGVPPRPVIRRGPSSASPSPARATQSPARAR